MPSKDTLTSTWSDSAIDETWQYYLTVKLPIPSGQNAINEKRNSDVSWPYVYMGTQYNEQAGKLVSRRVTYQLKVLKHF